MANTLEQCQSNTLKWTSKHNPYFVKKNDKNFKSTQYGILDTPQ